MSLKRNVLTLDAAPASSNKTVWGAIRATFAAVLAAMLLVIGVAPAHADDAANVENPAWPTVGCADGGLDIAIMMDLSGSIKDAQVQTAITEVSKMVDDLADYPVRFAVNSFDSEVPAIKMQDQDPSFLQLTPVNAVITDDKGDPVLDDAGQQQNVIKTHIANWDTSGSTNWELALQSLVESQETYHAVLFITDGIPNYTADGTYSTTDAPIAAAKVANSLKKQKGTRVVVVGLTENVQSQMNDFTSNVQGISGTKGVEAPDRTGFTEDQILAANEEAKNADYFTTGFKGVGDTIKGLVEAVCGQMTVSKTATPDWGKNGVADEKITYEFMIENKGKQTLKNVKLSDQFVTDKKLKLEFAAWPGKEGELKAGESVTAKAVYTVTNEDRKAGSVDAGVAVAESQNTRKPIRNITIESNPVSTILAPAAITITDTTKTIEAKPGDVIPYSFEITNSGEQDLFDVAIDLNSLRLTDVKYVWPEGTQAQIAKGAVVKVSGNYKLTQADIDRGEVINTARATGNPPIGPAVSSRVANSTPVKVTERKGDISLVKTAELDQRGGNVPGDVVTFHFTAKNEGNVTLKNVKISDKMPGLSELSYVWPGEAGVLAPGEIVTASATYKLTANDIASGKLNNSASVTGETPEGFEVGTVTDQSEASVKLVAKPKPKKDKSDAKPNLLPKTGSEAGMAAAAVVTILVGAGAVVARRKQLQ